MSDKTLFVIGGDIVYLTKDYTPINDYYDGITIKQSLLKVDGHIPAVYFDEFLCYPDTIVNKKGETIDNRDGFYIPIDICVMHETRWEHLPEKEYSDE